jgi:hypothetical protein
MNLYFIILIFILLTVISFVVYNEFKNQKLLKTVTRHNRGTRSERKMVLKLLKSGIKSTAIFHDLYLERGNNSFSQIDLVVATKVGIMVFEIKEYKGWIFGTENQRNWTQLLSYGEEKYQFYNPILQNNKHIADLKKVYPFDNVPFFSIIVFFGNCDLKNNLNLPQNTFVEYASKVMYTVEEIITSNPDANYLNKWEIVRVLEKAVKNGDDPNILKRHIENITKLKSRYKRFT